MPTAGLPSELVTVNQSEFRPRAPAKASPVSDTLWSEPTRVIAVTRPPKSPSPFRPVMSIASSVPSCGQVASTVVTAIDAVQVWSELQALGTQIESPASGTAGNAPGAVSPPVEAEYWVAATAPPGNSMTLSLIHISEP